MQKSFKFRQLRIAFEIKNTKMVNESLQFDDVKIY